MVWKKLKSRTGLSQSNNKQDTSRRMPQAVALSYDASGGKAPIISASGERKCALLIKKIARRYGVPVKIRPELVRALAKCAAEEQIPESLYNDVAGLLCDLDEDAI